MCDRPAPRCSIFIDAAGRAPGLHARHRRAAIFLHDDREAVGQDPFLRGARRKRDGGGALAGGAALRSAVLNMTTDKSAKRSRPALHEIFGAGKPGGNFATRGFAGANGFTKAS